MGLLSDLRYRQLRQRCWGGRMQRKLRDVEGAEGTIDFMVGSSHSIL